MEEQKKEIEMFVAGLVLDPATEAPIVVLKDDTGEICLPIWIGMPEATAIASALKQVDIGRPMTHDLLKESIESLGGKVLRVNITELKDATFIAAIEVVVGDTVITLDSRPSDALALAVRTTAQIFVSQCVLEEAQVNLVSVDTDESPDFEIEENQESEDSRVFTSVDKEKWEQILAEMDPDDFKYKM